ncbi:uncharacterized protein LOC119547089 [Drosophila subpulchrella]|uniref:uncharacterized protein LOC119547089 n=1 Tax=Drosophila subpulchrella TaxID=1486046 RepID=UPI0018A19990|nr:uncharacterized protein LOC119547089 [Drosophila subpulchrella]
MGKSHRFYSQNSNQPLAADFSLEEQMIPRVQSNYHFGTNSESNRAYVRYMRTLVRVQGSIHRRFHNRSSRTSQAHHSRISAGGSDKNSDKSSQELKSNSQCSLNNKPVESSGQACDKPSKKSESSSCSKPEPVKSPCCDAPEKQRKCCVSFEQPLATEIPVSDPPFRDCPRAEPDDSHLPIIGVCCGQEPFREIQKTYTAETAKDYPPQRTTERRRCCSRPIIVVPTGEGTRRKAHPQPNSKVVTQDHPKSSPTSKPNSQNQSKPQSPDKSHNPPPYTEKSSVEQQTTCPICNQNYPAHSKCQCSVKFENSPSVEKPHCSSEPPPCSNCPAISDISKQLSEMNRRLEGLQCQELFDIRNQVDSLNASVQSLTSKCVETKGPPKKLERKPSSTCQFCRGQSLTQLDSFHCQLMDLIGNRCLTDIVISIFLRADNLYHVNVRDLSSGCSLGCFLVTDAAIEEAIELGVFQEILTFSVIDVRNTIKPKSCPLGISFEFHHADRQSGGCDHKARGDCMVGKDYVARVLGLPLEQLKYVYSVPQERSDSKSKKSSKHSSNIVPGISSRSTSKQSRFEGESRSSSRNAVQEIATIDEQLISTDDEDKNLLSDLETSSLSGVGFHVKKSKKICDLRKIAPTRNQNYFINQFHKKNITRLKI